MDDRDRSSAERARSRIAQGRHDPTAFRAELLAVAPVSRDGWLDHVLGLGELADDGPELPRDCVPYLPSSVDVLLRMVELAPVRPSDTFVDVGSGVGRAAALVHLLTGASVVGVEIQPRLVRASRDLAVRLRATRMTLVEGDAAELAGPAGEGTVYFLYCPFSGDRLARVLARLEPVARTRALCICCLDLPLPARPWLALDPRSSADLTIHVSRWPEAPPRTRASSSAG